MQKSRRLTEKNVRLPFTFHIVVISHRASSTFSLHVTIREQTGPIFVFKDPISPNVNKTNEKEVQMSSQAAQKLCRLCFLQTVSDDSVNIWDKFQNSTIASIVTKHFWFEVIFVCWCLLFLTTEAMSTDEKTKAFVQFRSTKTTT